MSGQFFIHVERVELVNDHGRFGLLLRRHSSGWWSVLTDTGEVLADTESEREAQAALDGAVAAAERVGAFVRRRWRNAGGVQC